MAKCVRAVALRRHFEAVEIRMQGYPFRFAMAIFQALSLPLENTLTHMERPTLSLDAKK